MTGIFEVCTYGRILVNFKYSTVTTLHFSFGKCPGRNGNKITKSLDFECQLTYYRNGIQCPTKKTNLKWNGDSYDGMMLQPVLVPLDDSFCPGNTSFAMNEVSNAAL